MAKRRVEFRVSFILPEGASLNDAKSYVDEAVSCMCGGLNPGYDDCPGDPMFSLDGDTVRVTTIRRRK